MFIICIMLLILTLYPDIDAPALNGTDDEPSMFGIFILCQYRIKK